MPRLIEARYGGRCKDCGDTFVAGDLIGFNRDGKPICEGCRVDMAIRESEAVEVSQYKGKPEVACPICFLTVCEHTTE